MKPKTVKGVTYIQVHELQHGGMACEGCAGEVRQDVCNALSICSAGVHTDNKGRIWIVDSEPAKVAYITLKLEAS